MHAVCSVTRQQVPPWAFVCESSCSVRVFLALITYLPYVRRLLGEEEPELLSVTFFLSPFSSRTGPFSEGVRLCSWQSCVGVGHSPAQVLLYFRLIWELVETGSCCTAFDRENKLSSVQAQYSQVRFSYLRRNHHSNAKLESLRRRKNSWLVHVAKLMFNWKAGPLCLPSYCQKVVFQQCSMLIWGWTVQIAISFHKI